MVPHNNNTFENKQQNEDTMSTIYLVLYFSPYFLEHFFLSLQLEKMLMANSDYKC